MQFTARVLSADHLLVNLQLEARDETDAREQLRARGMHPTGVTMRSGARSRAAGAWRGSRSARFSLALFSQELLALLEAGLGIVECLEALAEKEASPAAGAVLARLLGGLRDGRRFSDVLAEQPLLFPPLFVGVIRAAENTSDLPQALTRYIAFQQRIDRVRDKLVAAAIYPAILAVVGAAVCLFLIIYVVPRFASAYESAGRSMPWLSQLLVDCGRALSGHSFGVAAAALALVAAIGYAVRSTAGRVMLGEAAARLPLLGERLRIVRLARIYFTLGMLLEGGISVVGALGAVQASIDPVTAARLRMASRLVESGQSLSVALEAHGLVTPISLRLLRVGERSGALGAMLTQSAVFYDGEITRSVERFLRMFEPLLMAVIGLVVGAIVVLLYLPIFDLAGGLS